MRILTVCVLLSLFVAAGPTPAAAGTIIVSVEEAAGARSIVEPIPAIMTAQAVAAGPHAELPPKCAHELLVPGEVTVGLDRATWRLDLSVEGFWSEPKISRLEEEDHHVRFELWPVGTIRARVGVAGNGEPPERLEVHFEPIPRKAEAESLPAGEVTCRPQEDVWTCRIPAGRLDLRFTADGYVTQYRWDVEVAGGGVVELEPLVLRRGSAVSGWVENEKGEPVKETQVALSPRSLGLHRNAVDRARMKRLTLQARTNHRGFFQIAGVEAGEYVIEANKVPFAPARATVQVLEGGETLIADPPLVLRAPQVIEAYVDPPVPPVGEHWTIRLVQLDRSSQAMAVIEPTPVSLAGFWSSEPLAPGRYWLTLYRKDAERWFGQELELDNDTAPVFIDLPVVRVCGTVLLGDDPLPATVWFGGKTGAVSVKLVTDSDGRFEGFLPRAGRWNIDIAAAKRPVRRSFQREIIKPPGIACAELDLPVPNTRFECLVVHESGVAAPGAIVDITSQEEVATDRESSDDEGRFDVYGLPPGLVTVKASKGYQDSFYYSDEIAVMLEEGEEPELVTLVLRPELRIRGRVIAGVDGRGVPGARIKAEPCQMRVGIIRMHTSDAAGYFEVHLPAETREFYLSVAAPGYAFEFLRLPADPDRDLVIPVGWASGTLIGDLPASFDRDSWDSPLVLLYHSGAREHLSYLVGWWATFEGKTEDGKNHFIIPSMKPGQYNVCLADRFVLPTLVTVPGPCAVCVTGNLPEAGELELSFTSMPGSCAPAQK